MTQELLGRVHRELLDVLNSINQDKIHHDGDDFHELLNDVEKTLAQPEQEPVAWRWKERINSDFDSWVISASEPPPYSIEQQPLYTTPPQRKPLTPSEINQIEARWDASMHGSKIAFVVRETEAAHGIKE